MLVIAWLCAIRDIFIVSLQAGKFLPEGSVARIPDDVVERLKAEVSLVSLAEAAGVELRSNGTDLTGCCPFHEDGSPSLVISRPGTCGTAWARARPAGRWSTG